MRLLMVRIECEGGPDGRQGILVKGETGATRLGPRTRMQKMAMDGRERRVRGDGGCVGGGAVAITVVQVGSRGGERRMDVMWGEDMVLVGLVVTKVVAEAVMAVGLEPRRVLLLLRVTTTDGGAITVLMGDPRRRLCVCSTGAPNHGHDDEKQRVGLLACLLACGRWEMVK